jgi:predicted aspartyl protease
MHHRILLFASLFCSAFLSLHADTEIPFSYRSGFIFLAVTLDGQPQNSPLRFILDSGAGESVLNLQSARRLGLKLASPRLIQNVEGGAVAYSVTGLSASVGPVKVPSSMLAMDIAPATSETGGRFDGLLGMDFFRGRILEIDYARQKIRLMDRRELSFNGATILPLVSHLDAFCLRVGVNAQRPELMRLDTGCNSTLEWASHEARKCKLSNTSIATATQSRRSISTDLVIGPERLSSIDVRLHEGPFFDGETGLLGNGVLSHFRITVDAPKSRLILRRVDGMP